MSKLVDVNYALMAQLSYLHWNKLEENKKELLENILLKDEIFSQIITEFYDIPKHYPKNESINRKNGELSEYTYHEEDKRLFLVYSLDKSRDRIPLFKEELEGWSYLECATGEMIEKIYFGEEVLRGTSYKESGFFGVAFQKGEDIIIAYRGTEAFRGSPDISTDINIFIKKTDIQQVEAVLFYEYIKLKYGDKKRIHLTGHSLAGALVQYVYFYASYNGNYLNAVTWNGLGAEGSAITAKKFQAYKDEEYYNINEFDDINNESRAGLGFDRTVFTSRIRALKLGKGISKDVTIDSQKIEKVESRIRDYYENTTENSLKNHLENLKKREESDGKMINYYMDIDFVSGLLNNDWIGEKILVNVSKDVLVEKVNKIAKGTDITEEELKVIENIINNREQKKDEEEFNKIMKTKGVEAGAKEIVSRALKQINDININKLKAAFVFHNLNNYLVFMDNSGNVTPRKIRKEFRKNMMKTAMKLRENRYIDMKKNGTEYEIRVKKGELGDISFNESEYMVLASNRVIRSDKSPFSGRIKEEEVLFIRSFLESENKFSGEDVIVHKNNKNRDEKFNWEENCKSIMEIGEYCNVESLGEIKGKEAILVYVYEESEKIEEKEEQKKEKISSNYTRYVYKA